MERELTLIFEGIEMEVSYIYHAGYAESFYEPGAAEFVELIAVVVGEYDIKPIMCIDAQDRLEVLVCKKHLEEIRNDY